MNETIIDLVYDVLQVHGANPDMRLGFARWFNEPDQREWRFQGELGFGGKFRRNRDRWYVTCYSEDETQLRLDIIAAINQRLSTLRPLVDVPAQLINLQSDIRSIREDYHGPIGYEERAELDARLNVVEAKITEIIEGLK